MAGRWHSFRKSLAYRVGKVKLGPTDLFSLMTFYDLLCVLWHEPPLLCM